MDFFGIGPLELVVILLVAFLILGPAKLAETVRNVGKSIKQFQRSYWDIRGSIEKELSVEEDKKRGLPQDQGNDGKRPE